MVGRLEEQLSLPAGQEGELLEVHRQELRERREPAVGRGGQRVRCLDLPRRRGQGWRRTRMRQAPSSVTPPRTTAAWSQPRRKCYCTADAQLVREAIRGGQKDRRGACQREPHDRGHGGGGGGHGRGGDVCKIKIYTAQIPSNCFLI